MWRRENSTSWSLSARRVPKHLHLPSILYPRPIRSFMFICDVKKSLFICEIEKSLGHLDEPRAIVGIQKPFGKRQAFRRVTRSGLNLHVGNWFHNKFALTKTFQNERCPVASVRARTSSPSLSMRMRVASITRSPHRSYRTRHGSRRIGLQDSRLPPWLNK